MTHQANSGAPRVANGPTPGHARGLIRNGTAVTVGSSLGQRIYACPANENVGCPHAKEPLGRGSHRDPAGRQVSRCRRTLRSRARGHRAAGRRGSGARRQGDGRGIRRDPGQSQDAAAEPAHHDPGQQGRRDRHCLLARPHRRPAEEHLPVHAEGDRRDRGRALLPARGGRPQGHPARDEPQRAVGRDRAGRVDPHPAVREERLRGGGGRRPGQGRAGHPADDRPQGPGAEVRDPGRGRARQEEDPGELPQHHLLRAAGVRHRGRLPPVLLQVGEGPEAGGGRAAGRPRAVAEPLRPGQ